MINMFWGRKIGMTQLFSSNGQKIIPVTVIEFGDWITLQRKKTDNDGYESVQIGLLRKKYRDKQFSLEWLKDKNKYFLFVKEVKCSEGESFEIGSKFSFENIFQEGNKVDASGKITGKGFQGTIKRYGFSGGRGSHGDKLGRKPGSLSGLRTQGMVFKGKKGPGQDGCTYKTIKNLTVVKFDKDKSYIAVCGAVPGKSGSLIKITKEQYVK